ncbi:hypothetical protein F9C07_2285297 [Aspergillus flavus]|uniref:Uncharacterized protein n=2 Tax=Aspergillus subgen. Circumdati TaxID=2720871 RepID=A0A7G5KBD8_ASPFN|nr:uncharacterized protein G4B84_008578 [Aspergillus flavus NRRL3357]EIT83158.1 hypothetical protein Ao3042_11622 [Aspergillus oryzae 3.042]KAJ1708152.1 hypothetical protein NYO67_9717 [Aspergillus flavus]KDE83201.1 hypothetical protein AO1008_09722 [Aspergillus oryzae 100-8]KAF7616024.1 hypothetical protein AFLA_009528 [Aspergillus flavus NRRL3357]QMW33147.1 hypothetical protein G4B84_008578 [Aspergillus flavus NRRL3357]|eukprot:EIT83158.1 hypothetical protein Ao3042_11622 [Aspergillus oryzae 3.042]
MTLRVAEKTSKTIKSESPLADGFNPTPGNSWGVEISNRASETDKLRQKVEQMNEKLDKLLKQNETYHATSEFGGTGQDDTYNKSGWPADPNDEYLGQAVEDDGCQDAYCEHSWTEEDEMPELENVNGDSGLGHEWTAEDSWGLGRAHDDSGLGDEVALTETNVEADELRDQVKCLQARLADLLAENTQLTMKVKELVGGRDDLIPSRNCFLSLYKCQKLQRALTLDECEHLVHASTKVASGDVMADSELYISGERKDYDVFVDLYGVDPHAVPSVLKDQHTIELVNAHATILASKHKTYTSKFEERFARFITNLRRTGYPEDYLIGFMDDVGILELQASYTAFRNALLTEVSDALKAEVMNDPVNSW